jgi:2-methylcitrate dehydratase PrpD
MAMQFARAQRGVAEATVLATDIRTSAVNAALAKGMFAHADETDDFEPVTRRHDGAGGGEELRALENGADQQEGSVAHH